MYTRKWEARANIIFDTKYPSVTKIVDKANHVSGVDVVLEPLPITTIRITAPQYIKHISRVNEPYEIIVGGTFEFEEGDIIHAIGTWMNTPWKASIEASDNARSVIEGYNIILGGKAIKIDEETARGLCVHRHHDPELYNRLVKEIHP